MPVAASGRWPLRARSRLGHDHRRGARRPSPSSCRGVVFGGDDAMAKALAEQITGRASPRTGRVMKVAVTLPKRDELAPPAARPADDARAGPARRRGPPGRRRARRHQRRRGPRRQGRRAASGFATIAGAVTGELGPGEIEIDQAGSVAIETRRSQVRIATSPARSRSRRAAATSAPAASAARRTSRPRDIEAELEDLAGPLTPHRLRRRGARPRRARRRSTAETRAHHAEADARHGGRDHGDDRARRDRADAAARRRRCSTRTATDGDIRVAGRAGRRCERSGDDAKRERRRCAAAGRASRCARRAATLLSAEPARGRRPIDTAPRRRGSAASCAAPAPRRWRPRRDARLR